jgi:DNA-binding CsgD family transcriptional regulator
LQDSQDKQKELPFLLRRRYRLAEWLGRGSLGVTYRARDESLGRPVVVKFLAGGQGVSAAERTSFLDRAGRLAGLSHPNILPIYDFGQEQDWDYLVLDYAPGGDLRRRLQARGGRLPPAEALGVAASLLQALAYAHGHGILHGNLKPANILLTAEGQLKLADFSLGRGFEGVAGVATDLHTLGAVLYELLTGRLPLAGENHHPCQETTPSPCPEPPSSWNAEISPALDRFVLRLLAADPGQRFPGAAAALAALEDLRRVSPAEQAASDSQIITLDGAASRAVSAVEADRRQLAAQVQAQIIDPLKLLLAQAAAFEQTLTAQPASRTAVSVLASLARQVLQQANDLEASLHPIVLETLGLEPALEALAGSYERLHSLRLSVRLERLAQRPPPAVELALFRLTQAVLDALSSQDILQADCCLRKEEHGLRLEFTCPGTASLPEAVHNAIRQRIEPFGGKWSLGRLADGQAHLVVDIPLRQEQSFTRRESQVLAALVQGWSNKEIARGLSISPRTVNYHLDHIFAKLGVRTRTEAAVIALRQGWAPDPSPAKDPPIDPG